MLRRAGVHEGVRLQGEDKVQAIHQKKDDASTSRYLQHKSIAIIGVLERSMKSSWQNQAQNAETQETGAHL